MESSPLPRVDRRTAIKWILTASASALLWDRRLLGASATPATAQGYGTDPDLTRLYKPGDLWPLTLTDPQRVTVTALCDLIIPLDAHSSNASSVGVPDFIDEWISAPYPVQTEDRKLILDGLAWLDTESNLRFAMNFASGGHWEMTAICDGICNEDAAPLELKTAAKFFSRFRDLTTGGFYTTPEGMKDVGYIGNVPLASFDGPPPELLQRLGIID
jgi:hypothetical protein